MARTTKPADVRRNEIIDAALALFAERGYARTTINDILDAVGIAKGTFYHHFSAKEEVMRAAVLRLAQANLERARAAAADDQVPLPDRIVAVIASQRLAGNDAVILDSLHQAGNAEFHQLSHTAIVNDLTPVLTGLVEHGIATGEFDTPLPAESVAILLCATAVLTDDADDDPDFPRAWSRELMVPAILLGAERILGAAPGTFTSRAGAVTPPEP